MTAHHRAPTDPRPAPFEQVRAFAAGVEAMVTSEDMARKPHTELEEMLAEKGRQWARMMLEENLRLRAMVEQRRTPVGADGVERRRARHSERQLETILGRVTVERLAYQAPGSMDLHPMDAALNLPPGLHSYGLRRLVAREAARASFDEVVELAEEMVGKPIAKRQVEELAVAAAVDFDDFYEHRARQRNPSEDLLILSTDAKGIVMRPQDLREGTQKARAKSQRKLETRLTPGEKANRKRMAQVAVVYSVAPFVRSAGDVLHSLRDAEQVDTKRPRPTDKRVWASVDKSGQEVIREMFDEALRRDPERKRRWVVLVDGEPKQLRAVKREAKRAGVAVTILADIVHVIEYMWAAARALFGESNRKAEKWVEDRLLALLTGRSGGELAKSIRWWEARSANLTDAAHAAIDTTCRYLTDRNRTRLLKYKEALAAGLPIATGVVEGACRHVVKDRMDRTGARWSLTGAEAILRLRALRASKDFDEYWTFHLAREHDRNHASRYEDGRVPDPMPPRRPKLKRVK